MRCYIFDLDGAVCNIEHRLHYIRAPEGMTTGQVMNAQNPATVFKPRWDEFYAACVGDAAIIPICALLADLGRQAPIVFSSGRSDAVRHQTMQWLYINTMVRPGSMKLYMRKDADHRPDYVVKAELLDQILADGYLPIMAFEDRDQVVKMYRERGITCAQVAEGNF